MWLGVTAGAGGEHPMKLRTHTAAQEKQKAVSQRVPRARVYGLGVCTQTIIAMPDI